MRPGEERPGTREAAGAAGESFPAIGPCHVIALDPVQCPTLDVWFSRAGAAFPRARGGAGGAGQDGAEGRAGDGR